MIAVLSPLSDRSTVPGKETGLAKNVKLTATYAPLDTCLRDHHWAGLTRKQTKELNPAAVFSILGKFGYFAIIPRECMLTCLNAALWEYQSKHGGSLPNDVGSAGEVEGIAAELLSRAGVNKQALSGLSKELTQYEFFFGMHFIPDVLICNFPRTLSTTAAYELSPVCAVVGGMLAQDILKALAAREPPIANFFTFDGSLGGGTVCQMCMS